MRIHSDPDPGQNLKSQKDEFLHEMKNIPKVGNRSKDIPYPRRLEILFERQETWIICKLWSISISILLDPDPHSQYCQIMQI
jgi:hypothetical protein